MLGSEVIELLFIFVCIVLVVVLVVKCDFLDCKYLLIIFLVLIGFLLKYFFSIGVKIFLIVVWVFLLFSLFLVCFLKIGFGCFIDIMVIRFLEVFFLFNFLFLFLIKLFLSVYELISFERVLKKFCLCVLFLIVIMLFV